MNLLIINEKPDQAKSFAKALGGKAGFYNGNQYQIEALHGHIMQLKAPQFQIKNADWEEDVSVWSNTSRIPWTLDKFLWSKEPKPKPKGSKFKSDKDRVAELKKLSKTVDAIVIATDNDPSGEGDLLAQEVIDTFNFKGKILRCYFADDSEKEIQKGMDDLKDVTDPLSNNKLQMAITREQFDYATMQLSRLATKYCRENKCSDVVVRPGRLKSYLSVLVYNRLYDREMFVIKDLFRPIFVDDKKNKFINKEIDKLENRDMAELDMQKLKQSEVVVSGTQRKKTAPPSLLSYDKVNNAVNILAGTTVKNKEFINTYQKMYDKNILSYPRTEDKQITKGQWDQMMPIVDKIASVVGVDPSILKNRTARKPYVTDKNLSHGANRPGLVVPNSLDELKSFGRYAPIIYKALAFSFLSIMCDDYEYDSTKAFIKDYPLFTATKNVGVKQGYKVLLSQLEDKKDKDKQPEGLFGKIARPEIEQSKSKPPQAPTQVWIFSELEKNNIGTGATRVAIMAELLEGKKQIFKQKGKTIDLTPEGYVTGYVLRNTLLSTAKVTKQLHDLCVAVGDSKMPISKAYEIANYIIQTDSPIMKRNAETLYTDSYLVDKIPTKKNNSTEKWRGVYVPTGEEIAFGKESRGVTISESQSKELLNGQTIRAKCKKKTGQIVDVDVRLKQQSFKDKKTKKDVVYWGVDIVKWVN